MTQRLSLRELARRLDRDKSGLSRLASKGIIPKDSDGKFDEAEVRAALTANTDPARRKALPVSQSSTVSQSPVNAQPLPSTRPTPEAYRSRTDLPDAFAAGALYGAHVVAFALPTAVACALIEAGIPATAAIAAHAEACDDARFIVGEVTEALGLTPEGVEDAGPHNPTSFQTFNPQMALMAVTP